MKTRLERAVILVDDYDQAYEFYHKNFFCTKIYDTTMPDGRRYLHIRFTEDDDTGIWFLKAEASDQRNNLGKQTAGQPTIVIYTDDIASLYKHVKETSKMLVENLVSSNDNKFFHCQDLYGNRLTIVELTK